MDERNYKIKNGKKKFTSNLSKTEGLKVTFVFIESLIAELND